MNSSLVDYTKLSPNYNKRNNKIKKLTIHHCAGNLSVETMGNIFASPSREASANYGIDLTEELVFMLRSRTVHGAVLVHLMTTKQSLLKLQMTRSTGTGMLVIKH